MSTFVKDGAEGGTPPGEGAGSPRGVYCRVWGYMVGWYMDGYGDIW